MSARRGCGITSLCFEGVRLPVLRVGGVEVAF